MRMAKGPDKVGNVEILREGRDPVEFFNKYLDQKSMPAAWLA
jgi:hypothetical protein